MLAMGRALMINPKLLLLDEPLEGLAPLVAKDMLSSIKKMVDETRTAVILVEQHAGQILPLTEHALVLERGQVAFSGKSAQLLDDPALLERWLAVSTH